MVAMWGLSIGTALVVTQRERLFPISHSRIVLGHWLGQTTWIWPLAVTAGLAVLTSPRVRQRWPEQRHRGWIGLGVAVGLVALTILTMYVGPSRGLLALGAIVLVVLLAVWVLVLPNRLAPTIPAATLDRLSDVGRLEATNAQVKLHNDLRTTALQAIAGLAVLAGAFLGFQQLSEDRQQAAADRELVRQGQASERFTRAINQLGSDRREVQLGGIYGLEQIAEQAPDNYLAVTQVLVAYLHRRAPRSAKPTTDAFEELRVRAPDVQAVLTVLQRTYDEGPSLDLRELDLRGAVLEGPNLASADFRGSDLRDASFIYINLRGAKFSRADLRGASLSRAYFGSQWDGPTAKFRKAKADESTSWPTDFDWRKAGVLAVP
jgi:hypothetical protein